MKIINKISKLNLLSLLILFLLNINLQAQRATSASQTFNDYRPIGETRVWTFIIKDSVIGQLLSTVEEEVEIDGEDGFSINDRIYLDYGKIGNPVIIDVSGDHFVSVKGTYLGDDLKINVNNQVERLFLERDDKKISGFITQKGEESDFELSFSKDRFAIDNNFMDHYETYFAMRDLKVGDIISDSIFIPQTGLMGVIEGEVSGFSWQQLHRTLFDSVFVINLTSPQDMEIFFTPDKRLLKTNIHSLDMRIYLDAVQQRPVSKSSSYSLSRFISLLPLYGIFLIVGLFTILFVKVNNLFNKINLIALISGIISVSVIIWIQFPIQNILYEKLYAPAITAGEPSYLMGLFTTIPAGLIQELLKLTGIISVLSYLKCSKNNSKIIGAIFGVALGVAEAFYLTTLVPPQEVFNMGLIERISWIVFHGISGALIGWVYFRKIKKLYIVLVCTLLLNVLMRSLPYLSPLNLLATDMIFLSYAVIVSVFLMISLVIFRK